MISPGHQYLLLKCHILHRDISVFNIVYDARREEGSHGRIIDLDLAEDVNRLWSTEHQSTEGDGRTVRAAAVSMDDEGC